MNKIVWCNGTFDILHPGHIELFKIGKSLGDKLIVATDTDEKIRQDKGPSKPINNLCDRVSMLQAIKYIDEVFYFNDRKELIKGGNFCCHFSLCLIDFIKNFFSLRIIEPTSCAIELTLNGPLIFSKISIIDFELYAQPKRKPARA